MAKLPPGFRFSPSDIELIMYYLKRKIMGKNLLFDAISELNIYKFSPWDLPDKCCYKSKDLEWYFFCPRERKYGTGARLNRATKVGYWKATGKDRSVPYEEKIVGYVKTLVFHEGHAPRGKRTDWVLHEYRFEDKDLAGRGVPLGAYVLCKVFHKSGPGPKNGARYGAPFKEDEWVDDDEAPPQHNISSLPVFPDNRGCSNVTSMPDPAFNEVDPSSTPPNLGVISPLPALSEMVDSGNNSLLHVAAESGPPANPCCQKMPPDEYDDIMHLLGIFVEDQALASPEIENNLSHNNLAHGMNVEAAPVIGGNDIYSGLGDLDDFANLDQTQGNDYGQDPIFFLNDHLELDDLDVPLNHSAEIIEKAPPVMDYFSAPHDSDAYLQQFSFGGNSSAVNHQVASQNQLHMLPENYTRQFVHSEMVNYDVPNVNQGYNAAGALDFTYKQPENNSGYVVHNWERGEQDRKSFCCDFSKHVKAEVILWVDGCTNDALSAVLEDFSSNLIPQLVDVASGQLFYCCYEQNKMFCCGFSIHVKAEVILWVDGRTNDALSTVLGDSSCNPIPQLVEVAFGRLFYCCNDQHRKLCSNILCYGFSKHVKAEVICGIDGCTNDALTVLGDHSSVLIPQLLDVAYEQLFYCCYDLISCFYFGISLAAIFLSSLRLVPFLLGVEFSNLTILLRQILINISHLLFSKGRLGTTCKVVFM